MKYVTDRMFGRQVAQITSRFDVGAAISPSAAKAQMRHHLFGNVRRECLPCVNCAHLEETTELLAEQDAVRILMRCTNKPSQSRSGYLFSCPDGFVGRVESDGKITAMKKTMRPPPLKGAAFDTILIDEVSKFPPELLHEPMKHFDIVVPSNPDIPKTSLEAW